MTTNSICHIFIYWIPTIHKNRYKHQFIDGSAKCSTKPLSILLTKLLTHIKKGLQKYCEVAYSRCSVNQMWNLKNSSELLKHLLLKVSEFQPYNKHQVFRFSTLQTSISHNKLNSRFASISRNSFIFKTVTTDTNI